MEQNWAKTRSGPFPERARNAIAKLRASLEERDTETIPLSQLTDPVLDVRHITTTSAPAYAATPTTTSTITTTTTPAASVSITPITTPAPTSTTAVDPSSNAAVEPMAIVTQTIPERRSTKLPDNEVNERRTEGEEDERQQREEKGKRVEKEGGTRE